MGSPGSTTEPTVTSLFSTRPPAGASTCPSLSCCWITARSAVRARRPFSATLSAVRASSSLTRGRMPRSTSPSVRVKSICAWSDCACKRADLRVQRFHLQRQLLVADGRNRLAAGDRIAFPDIELDDDAANAPARRHHADALDGGEHRLLVGDRPRRDGQGFRAGRGRAAMPPPRQGSMQSIAASRSSAISWQSPAAPRAVCPASHSRFIADDFDLPQGTAAARPHKLRLCLRGFRGRAIDLIERLQDLARGLACDRVVDRLGVAPRRYQAILAKERKMLGHRGIAQDRGMRRGRRPSARRRSTGK